MVRWDVHERRWFAGVLGRSRAVPLVLALGCGGGGADGSSDSNGDSFGPLTVSGTDGVTTASTSGGASTSSAGTEDSTADTDPASQTATATAGDETSDATSVATSGETSDGGSGSDETEGVTGGETDPAQESSGGEPPSDDPFDPTACDGTPWTGADALARLGGLDREVLAGATIQVRTRTCPGGTCGPWGANEGWMIHYLTWSGGVKTRWKDILAEMELVLFDDGGTPTLSMQHVTFAAGGYPDDDGVLYEFPPDVVNYPHLRAYNQFPDQQYDYIDLDYQVSDGVMVLGDGCAVWTADPFGAPEPHTAQFGALFRW